MNMQNTEAAKTATSVLADPATAEGLADLAEKVAPLLQGRRFHNVVDILSAASDVVDLADEQLVIKLSKLYEGAIGVSWSATNALRVAAAEAADARQPPSLWQLSRRLGDPDVRRGLHFVIALMGAVGRQVQADEAMVAED